jgi:hypothetical protein
MVLLNIGWYVKLVAQARNMFQRVKDGKTPTPDYDHPNNTSSSSTSTTTITNNNIKKRD